MIADQGFESTAPASIKAVLNLDEEAWRREATAATPWDDSERARSTHVFANCTHPVHCTGAVDATDSYANYSRHSDPISCTSSSKR